jgi:hypothetical protein
MIPLRTAFSSALLGLSLMSSGCSDGGSLAPPLSPGTPNPPPVTYTVSGSVSELSGDAIIPVADARISDSSGRSAVTDDQGRYSLSGLTAATRSLSITKPGYLTAVRMVTMTADVQVDIRIERIRHYVLSGMVFEMTESGRVPVEGVELYCDSCGSPDGHTFVYTDANGLYRLEWTLNGVHPLFVTKPGYDIFDPTGTLRDQHGRISAAVDGDTRFDIQVRRQ